MPEEEWVELLKENSLIYDQVRALPFELRKPGTELIKKGKDWDRIQDWEECLEAKRQIDLVMARIIQESISVKD